MAAIPEDIGRGPRWRVDALLPQHIDRVAFVLLVLGFAAMYAPTYWRLSQGIWASDEQGHGPLILIVAMWLLWRLRDDVAALPRQRIGPRLGWPLLALASLVYALGRSQDILIFEVGSQILVIAALLLLFRGPRALRLAWFPLFFLIFMIPLPGPLVAAVTGPLKAAVSAVAATLMHAIGYPIGRSGVILSIGPYQLLVADACAGLNSMFSLEALGLLYMNLMRYTSVARNVALAILIVPIAFCANVIRVTILVLITYHFGDEAGQGFVHGFAGIVLFLAALTLILTVDKLLGFWVRRREARQAARAAAAEASA